MSTDKVMHPPVESTVDSSRGRLLSPGAVIHRIASSQKMDLAYYASE